MKNIATVFLLLFATATFSQNPIDKKVGDFTTVKVFDLIHISLIKSDENRVEITGEDTQDVEVINKNGTLKVRMKIDQIFNGAKTFVAVYYTSLEVIDGNEGAKIVESENSCSFWWYYRNSW